MQSELPKPETVSSDYQFEWSVFLNENWFYLLAFIFILAVVVFYWNNRR